MSSTPSPNKILRLREVCARLGIARSTVYDKLAPHSPRFDSSFPRPIKLGPSAVGWLESSIEAWIQARVEASQGKQ